MKNSTGLILGLIGFLGIGMAIGTFVEGNESVVQAASTATTEAQIVTTTTAPPATTTSTTTTRPQPTTTTTSSSTPSDWDSETDYEIDLFQSVFAYIEIYETLDDASILWGDFKISDEDMVLALNTAADLLAVHQDIFEGTTAPDIWQPTHELILLSWEATSAGWIMSADGILVGDWEKAMRGLESEELGRTLFEDATDLMPDSLGEEA